MDDALGPQEALLGCQRSWTSYFFDLGTDYVVQFLLEGLSCPSQEPLRVFFYLAQDWALALDQQEAKEGEEEGSLEVQTYWPLGGKAPYSSPS